MGWKVGRGPVAALIPVMCHRNVAGGNYAGIILHRNYRLTPPNVEQFYLIYNRTNAQTHGQFVP